MASMGPRSWNAEKIGRHCHLIRSPECFNGAAFMERGKAYLVSTTRRRTCRFNGAAFMERGKGRSRKLFAGMVCDEQLRVA